MSVNSAVQQMAAGLGALVAGRVVREGADGRLTGYPVVGLLAAVVSLYCFGALSASFLEIHSSRLAALLPLAALLLVVVNAFIRERHQQQGSK